MRRRQRLTAILLSLLVAGCTSAPAPVVPTASPLPTQTMEPAAPDIGRDVRDVIWIQSPGPASRVLSPLLVRGEGDPVFEQSLVARLVGVDGAILAEQPLQIQAPLGERGGFELSIPFEVDSDTGALLQVFSLSVLDGGIEHLSSVGITLSADGPEMVTTLDDDTERLVLLSPASGSVISDGRLEVTGWGTASFEGTLLLSLLGADGQVLDEEILTIAAPEMGQPGEIRAELTFSVTEAQPGRIVLVDPLPVFDGIGHVTSVPVVLSP